MNPSIQSYYGYNEAKVGYVAGDKTKMAVCHSHNNPYKHLLVVNPTGESMKGFFEAALNNERSRLKDVSTKVLKEWQESLTDCINGIDDNLKSKLKRGDEYYRLASMRGCTEDGVVLRAISGELKKRSAPKKTGDDCTKCYQLARRILQLEADNQELLERIEKISKRNRCCSVFFWHKN